MRSECSGECSASAAEWIDRVPIDGVLWHLEWKRILVGCQELKPELLCLAKVLKATHQGGHADGVLLSDQEEALLLPSNAQRDIA